VCACACECVCVCVYLCMCVCMDWRLSVCLLYLLSLCAGWMSVWDFFVVFCAGNWLWCAFVVVVCCVCCICCLGFCWVIEVCLLFFCGVRCCGVCVLCVSFYFVDCWCWFAMMFCVGCALRAFWCLRFCCCFVVWNACVRVVCVFGGCVCVVCACLCVFVCFCAFACDVCAVVFVFPFCGDGGRDVAVVFLSVLCLCVWSCGRFFWFVLVFELTGCCAFLRWVVLLLDRLLARFDGVVYAGIGLSSKPFFVLECKLLARELLPRLALWYVFCCLCLC